MNLAFKRILAFFIDYIIIVVYAMILFEIVVLLSGGIDFDAQNLSPVKAQFLGFVFMTVPVFCYFYFTEKGKWKASVGKRIVKIKLEKKEVYSWNKSIFIRTFLKFLPWEIAHTGVHMLFYYEGNQTDVSILVWTLLILPQIIILAYITSIFLSKGKSSIYDNVANTSIINGN